MTVLPRNLPTRSFAWATPELATHPNRFCGRIGSDGRVSLQTTRSDDRDPDDDRSRSGSCEACNNGSEALQERRHDGNVGDSVLFSTFTKRVGDVVN